MGLFDSLINKVKTQGNPWFGDDDTSASKNMPETRKQVSEFSKTSTPQPSGFKSGVQSIIENDTTPPFVDSQDQEKPQHRGFLSKLFSTPKQETMFDSYGIPLPEKPKHSLFSKLANIGIPALVSLGGGAGLLPGIMAGMQGQTSSDEESFGNALDNYTKLRANAEDNALRKQQLDENKDYHAKQIGLGYSRINKGTKDEKEFDRYRDLTNKIANKQMVPKADLDFIDYYNAKMKRARFQNAKDFQNLGGDVSEQDLQDLQ